MTPRLKHLPEALLLLPLFWGSLAFAGWLVRQEQIWIDIGLMALGLGLIALVIALLIWGLRLLHPRLESPRWPWRVPMLAMLNILAIGVYFSIALSLPVWTRITLENLGPQAVTRLEVGCLEERHRRKLLDPQQRYRISCIPAREGALSISWFSGETRHAVQFGYLSPGRPQKLHLRIDAQGGIEGL